jgi:hypothetical protein
MISLTSRSAGRESSVTVRGPLSVAVVVGLFVGTGVALASANPLPLRDRLIKRGDFGGFRPESTKHSFKTAKAWVVGGPHPSAAKTSGEIARLRREGFVAVLAEFLDRGSARGSGLSRVPAAVRTIPLAEPSTAPLASREAASRPRPFGRGARHCQGVIVAR